MTLDAASRQTLRMSGLRNFPASEEGVKELIDSLANSAVTDEHGARMVDAWIRRSSFAPSPADVYRLADEVPTRELSSRPDRKCPGCAGTGWQQGWLLVTQEKTHSGGSYKSEQPIDDPEIARDLRLKVDGKQQVLYEGVRRCRECAYGREMAMDTSEVAQ